MRVVPNGEGAEFIFTLFRLPNMSDEKFADNQAAVEKDLEDTQDSSGKDIEHVPADRRSIEFDSHVLWLSMENKKEQFMSSDTQVTPASKKMLWAGRILSVLPTLMLLMSGFMKLTKPPELVEGFAKLGWNDNLALGLGIVELVSTALYVIPRTSVLGAILLTGYLGGAIATHVRIGDPFIAPVILGVVIWLGLYLRDARLRALIPLRS